MDKTEIILSTAILSGLGIYAFIFIDKCTHISPNTTAILFIIAFILTAPNGIALGSYEFKDD